MTQKIQTHSPDSGRGFLKASVSGGALSGTRLVVGFLRSKYVALSLGTHGVGFISLGTQLQILLSSLGVLGLSVSIINLGCSSSLTDDERQDAIRTAFTLELTASLALLAICFWKTAWIYRLMGIPADSGEWIWPIIFSLPLVVIVTGYFDPILLARGHYSAWIKASITSTILGFLAFVGLVWRFGIHGAFWAFGAMAVISLITYLAVFWRLEPAVKSLFALGVSRKSFASLFKVSFVALVPVALGYFLNLVIRGRVTAHLGLEANGILQVPLAITAYLTPFITNALLGKFQPMVSANGDSTVVRKELAAIVRLVMIAIACFASCLLCLDRLAVGIAYSDKFLPSVELMPYQLCGDFFYFIAFAISIYFLGAFRLRIYLFAWLGYYAVMAASSLYWIPLHGLKALPEGYLLASCVSAAVGLGWLCVRIDSERMETLWIFGASLASLALSILASLNTKSASPLRFLVAATTLGWAFWSTRRFFGSAAYETDLIPRSS